SVRSPSSTSGISPTAIGSDPRAPPPRIDPTMKHPNIRRRDFLKTSALTGVGLSMTGCSTTADAPSGSGNRGTSSALDRTPPRPPGQRDVAQLTTDPLERVRIGVIGLNRGLAHVRDCLGIGFAEVVAVCDIRDDRARAAAKACV